MDTTKTITHIGLCAGYGGIELGLKRVIPSMRSVALCEIEAFAIANLVAKMEAGLMDAAPIWTDLKTFPWGEFRDRVDILTGGYPCQPFSAAGKRLGTEDPRHLWPFIADGIRILRPRMCFFENVEGHISLGLREVIGDLGEAGYKTAWGIFSASEVGAPHQRKRVFILAHSGGERSQGLRQCCDTQGWKAPIGHIGSCGDTWQGGLADTNDQHGHGEERGRDSETQGIPSEHWQEEHSRRQSWRTNATHCVWPSRPGELQHGWEPPRVVVDTKSQRTNFGQQLRSEECGSWRALQPIPDSAGEPPRVVADSNKLRLEKHGLQHASVFVGSGGGQDGEATGFPNASHMRLEVIAECGQQHPQRATGASDTERVCACQAQEGRHVEHAENRSSGQQQAEQQGRDSAGGSGEAGAMGNPNSPRPQVGPWQRGSGIQGTDADGGEAAGGQTQPPLGGDLDGPSGRLGYAELCISTDNRTDELRLLGNGVVPATAARAFLTLWEELNK